MSLMRLVDVTMVDSENVDTCYLQNAEKVFHELNSILPKKRLTLIVADEVSSNLSTFYSVSRIIFSGAGIEFKFSFCRADDLIKLFLQNGYMETARYTWNNGHFFSELAPIR